MAETVLAESARLLAVGRASVPPNLLMIPFLSRLAALALVVPFALCIGLDVIAYAIARTLHLSMLQTRIPRSPSEPHSVPLPPANDEQQSIGNRCSSEQDDQRINDFATPHLIKTTPVSLSPSSSDSFGELPSDASSASSASPRDHLRSVHRRSPPLARHRG